MTGEGKPEEDEKVTFYNSLNIISILIFGTLPLQSLIDHQSDFYIRSLFLFC